jgi:hypothetical protein
VSVFAWRLLRDRLSTKVNLVSRGIISSADISPVCLDAVASSQLNIYSSVAVSLALFGRWSDRGLSFRRWIPNTFLNTSFSLFMPQVVLERDDPFYSSSGFFLCGFFGLNAIIGYSDTQNRLFPNLWIRSNVTLIGG